MAKLAARGRGRRTMNEINMVPFIDVMLVLLIIFMVTAPLITPSQIALPTVGQAQRQPDRFVQVLIDKSEQLRVREGSASGEGALVPLNLLAARVLELQGTGADQADRDARERELHQFAGARDAEFGLHTLHSRGRRAWPCVQCLRRWTRWRAADGANRGCAAGCWRTLP